MFTQRLSVNIKCSMRMITLITHYTRFNYLIIKTNQNVQTVIKYNFIFKGNIIIISLRLFDIILLNYNSPKREGGLIFYTTRTIIQNNHPIHKNARKKIISKDNKMIRVQPLLGKLIILLNYGLLFGQFCLENIPRCALDVY